MYFCVFSVNLLTNHNAGFLKYVSQGNSRQTPADEGRKTTRTDQHYHREGTPR